jgi:pyruvate/2-oxoglutarate dehydrogenase complex dihydrolipoamide dehydrogenase (E3) component
MVASASLAYGHAARRSTACKLAPYRWTWPRFASAQLGRAGLTEREARAQGRSIRVAKLPMSAVVRAIETGETRGFMKAVVDADSGQILGAPSSAVKAARS